MISDISEAQLARLPKWAQEEIGYQEQKIAELTARIAELSAGPEDSDTIAMDYIYPDRPLGKGILIRFLMPGGGRIEASVNRGSGSLELRADADKADSQSLAVQPSASNSLRVRLGMVAGRQPGYRYPEQGI
jgi:hypothetical protein